MRPRAWALIISLSVAAAGASAATIALAGRPGVIGCPGSAVTSVIDCRAVVTSPGGHILGLPLGVWGLVWLAVFWGLAVLRRGVVGWIVAAAAYLGIAYAVGTELKVGHLCVWCTLNQASIAALAAWRLMQKGGAEGGGTRPGS